MSFEEIISNLNSKTISLSQSKIELFWDKLLSLKLLNDCGVVLKTLFGIGKFLNQILYSCYWFLSVTSHFQFSIKHYELVSMLNVRIQRFQQVLSF